MLNSGLPKDIDDSEDLVRFLVQSDHFTRAPIAAVRHAAFEPSKKSMETSISRHGPEPADALWALGLDAARARTLYGAAFFRLKAVTGIGLMCLADEPPARHAVIRGWPIDSDPKEQKAKWKELTLLLAGSCGAPLFK